MRVTRTMLLALGCMLTLASAARADQTSEARKAIAAIYRKTDAAFNRKDVDGFCAYCTPDCLIVSEDGKKSSVAEQRRNTQGLYQVLQDPKITSTIQKIKVSGNTSIVTMAGRMTARGINRQTHATQVFAAVEVDRDTWINTGAGWRQKRSQTLSRHMTIDGKPFKPRGG